VRWNPLDEIRIGTEFETADIQNIASLIADPDGKGISTNDAHGHFKTNAWTLLVGCIAHVLYRAKHEPNKPATIKAISDLFADSSKKLKDVYAEMLCYLHLNGDCHPLVTACIQEQVNRVGEEAGSVVSTMMSFLPLYKDSIVAGNTAHSDFKIHDLMHSEEPVSLYLVFQPRDQERLQPLFRILMNMIIRLNTNDLEFENGHPKAHYSHRLLIEADEFASLGPMDFFQKGLSYMAGFGMKADLFIQDTNQLYQNYTQHESITSNCNIQCCFAPNRIETAEHISKLTGQTTIVKESLTTSHQGRGSTNYSKTTNEISRPLLTPDEAMRLKAARKQNNNPQGKIIEPGEMLIFVSGYPAIRGIQPLYFKDPELLRRAQMQPVPSPTPFQSVSKSPSLALLESRESQNAALN
jgi:type IV secretion system protein VirD4